MNTRNDEFENDGLADLPRGRAFLARHGLPGADGATAAGADDLAAARAVREALRALVAGTAGPAELAVLDAAADRAGLALRVRPEGAALVPTADGMAGALGQVLVAVGAAMADGSWGRLKACRCCAWVFYDGSRNRAGQWCAMSVCGNRTKTRRYRRARSTSTPS